LAALAAELEVQQWRTKRWLVVARSVVA